MSGRLGPTTCNCATSPAIKPLRCATRSPLPWGNATKPERLSTAKEDLRLSRDDQPRAIEPEPGQSVARPIRGGDHLHESRASAIRRGEEKPSIPAPEPNVDLRAIEIEMVDADMPDDQRQCPQLRQRMGGATAACPSARERLTFPSPRSRNRERAAREWGRSHGNARQARYRGTTSTKEARKLREIRRGPAMPRAATNMMAPPRSWSPRHRGERRKIGARSLRAVAQRRHAARASRRIARPNLRRGGLPGLIGRAKTGPPSSSPGLFRNGEGGLRLRLHLVDDTPSASSTNVMPPLPCLSIVNTPDR